MSLKSSICVALSLPQSLVVCVMLFVLHMGMDHCPDTAGVLEVRVTLHKSVSRHSAAMFPDPFPFNSFLGSIPVASYKGSRSAPRHRWSREGRLRIDFLRELQHYEPVLSMLFQFLSDKDLAAIGRTSSLWRKLCTTLPVARNRWKLYLESKRDAYECSRVRNFFPLSRAS